jgi:hypothetical protein
MATSVITIFVRHPEGCKYEGDESSRRCDCRKHLRWTPGRRTAPPQGRDTLLEEEAEDKSPVA